METINNIAASTAKAIWGPSDAHVEPISGKSGDVSKGEPYDAGNIEHVEDVQTTAPKVDTFDDPTTKNVEAADVAPLTDEPELKEQRNMQPETKPDAPKLGPSETQGSSNMTGDSTKMQNDVRDPSNPDTHSKNVEPKENVDDATDGLDKGDNPNKLDGPGPRPLAEIAKENGGDVGNAGKSSDAIGPDESGARQDSDGPQKENHGEGTGEQWVKSSGLTADGGDFDASAPGAGREADRKSHPTQTYMSYRCRLSECMGDRLTSQQASWRPRASNGKAPTAVLLEIALATTWMTSTRSA
ncbi:hypothetical protein B0T22DRAFT_21441 [Podospora appendiculata]|uniref:Uncharacterized protein n=1 Tax=Podospora appendiculata TaxID=314037 RepID=A0AAE0XFY1_9PEZI|nr:hypothetical protein B0T22DRAFT_21441 [Podospora appendiculata]